MIYLIEAIVNIVAVGLIFDYKSYLRVGWNLFDVFIILTGLLSLIPSVRESKVCTILTMLRSLKISYVTTSTRRLMTPWLHALKKMRNVFIFLVFILMIYAVISINEFKGNRYFRCRTTPQPTNGLWKIDESVENLCNAYGYGSYTCPSRSFCGTPDDYNLEVTFDEQFGSELVFYGAVGFENVIKSFLACFQVITFDDWAKIMYRMQDSNDSVLSSFLFPSLVFIGSFLCLNLIVAVVVDTFQNYRAELKEKDKQKLTKEKELAIPEDSRFGLRDSDSQSHKLFIMNRNLQPFNSIELEINEDKLSENCKEVAEGKQNEAASCNERLTNEKDILNCFDKTSELVNTSTKIIPKHTILNEDTQNSTEKALKSMESNKFYNTIAICLIVLNLLILSMNRKGITKFEILAYNIFDITIFAIYIIEMFLFIRILGFSKYICTKYLDLCINILGVVEVILTWIPAANSILLIH